MKSRRKKKNKNKKSLFPVVMGILWAGIVAMAIWILISIFTYKRPYYKYADEIADKISAEQFGELCSEISFQMDDGMTVENAPEYGKMMAIKHYVEASALYEAYLDNDQLDKAQIYQEKMEKALNSMGEFGYLEEKVENYLAR